MQYTEFLYLITFHATGGTSRSPKPKSESKAVGAHIARANTSNRQSDVSQAAKNFQHMMKFPLLISLDGVSQAEAAQRFLFKSVGVEKKTGDKGTMTWTCDLTSKEQSSENLICTRAECKKFASASLRGFGSTETQAVFAHAYNVLRQALSHLSECKGNKSDIESMKSNVISLNTSIKDQIDQKWWYLDEEKDVVKVGELPLFPEIQRRMLDTELSTVEEKSIEGRTGKQWVWEPIVPRDRRWACCREPLGSVSFAGKGEIRENARIACASRLIHLARQHSPKCKGWETLSQADLSTDELDLLRDCTRAKHERRVLHYDREGYTFVVDSRRMADVSIDRFCESQSSGSSERKPVKGEYT